PVWPPRHELRRRLAGHCRRPGSAKVRESPASNERPRDEQQAASEHEARQRLDGRPRAQRALDAHAGEIAEHEDPRYGNPEQEPTHTRTVTRTTKPPQVPAIAARQSPGSTLAGAAPATRRE